MWSVGRFMLNGKKSNILLCFCRKKSTHNDKKNYNYNLFVNCLKFKNERESPSRLEVRTEARIHVVALREVIFPFKKQHPLNNTQPFPARGRSPMEGEKSCFNIH